MTKAAEPKKIATVFLCLFFKVMISQWEKEKLIQQKKYWHFLLHDFYYNAANPGIINCLSLLAYFTEYPSHLWR